MSEQQTNKAESNPNLPQYMAEEIDRNPNGALAQAYKQSNGNLHDLLQIADRQGLIAQLPASMQGMVQEYQRDQQKARRDEEDFQRRMAAALAGSVFAMGEARNAEASQLTEQNTGPASRDYIKTPPSYDQFSQMSYAERMAYYDQINKMTLDQWSALGKDQRDKHIELDIKTSIDGQTAAGDNMISLNKEMKAHISKEQIAIVTSIGDVLDRPEFKDDSPAGLKKQEELLREKAVELSHQHPEIPAHYFLRYAEYQQKENEHDVAESAAAKARKENSQNNNSGSLDDKKRASAILQNSERRTHEKSLDKRDDLDLQVEAIMASGKTDKPLNSAIDKNLQARADADTNVAKAEVKKGLADDGFGDEPVAKAATPPQPVAAARAPSINVGDPPKIGPNSSVLAQLGAPEEVAPADPAVQMQRKAPSAGMGASA